MACCQIIIIHWLHRQNLQMSPLLFLCNPHPSSHFFQVIPISLRANTPSSRFHPLTSTGGRQNYPSAFRPSHYGSNFCFFLTLPSMGPSSHHCSVVITTLRRLSFHCATHGTRHGIIHCFRKMKFRPSFFAPKKPKLCTSSY